MSKTSEYQLYVSTKCSCCDKILALLESEQIVIPTINIDNEEYRLPFKLMILPALVTQKKLVGYGCDDIIKHLKAN